jgi:hypothetical protein
MAQKRKKPSNFSPNIESSDYCFAGPPRDIIAQKDVAGARILIQSFDAYGEPLPDSARSNVEVTKTTSAVLSRIGQPIFWLLVVVIFLARIFYFSASPAFEFRGVQDSKKGGCTIASQSSCSSGNDLRSSSMFSKARAAGIATRPGNLSFHKLRSILTSRIAMIFRCPSWT